MASSKESRPEIPVISIAALLSPASSEVEKQTISDEIGQACKGVGFFCISNVSAAVPSELRHSLVAQAHEVSRRRFCSILSIEALFDSQFFERPEEFKMQISMRNSKVYRGYFPLGDELTGGRPG
jgi:isopenicillin N synthase-like dioxygenase